MGLNKKRRNISRKIRTRKRGQQLSIKSTKLKHGGYEVGDIVTLHEHCRHAGRLAVITELPNDVYMGSYVNACKIQWIDEEGLREPPVSAILSNIKKLETEVEN